MVRNGLMALLGTAACSLMMNQASVQAYSLNPNVSCSLGDFAGASQCSGSYTLGGGENDVTNGGSSNIATQLLNNQDVFGGGGGWEFDFKTQSNTSDQGTSKVSWTGLGSTDGTLDVSNIDFDTTEIAISLKAAKGFSLYHITKDSLNDLTELDWSTIGTSQNNKGKAQGLSHASVYYRFIAEADKPVDAIPEPTSGLALLTIGAIAAKGALKKKNA